MVESAVMVVTAKRKCRMAVLHRMSGIRQMYNKAYAGVQFVLLTNPVRSSLIAAALPVMVTVAVRYPVP